MGDFEGLGTTVLTEGEIVVGILGINGYYCHL
jgi:hypothetical protein